MGVVWSNQEQSEALHPIFSLCTLPSHQQALAHRSGGTHGRRAVGHPDRKPGCSLTQGVHSHAGTARPGLANCAAFIAIGAHIEFPRDQRGGHRAQPPIEPRSTMGRKCEVWQVMNVRAWRLEPITLVKTPQ
jgi:hypothetical protein